MGNKILDSLLDEVKRNPNTAANADILRKSIERLKQQKLNIMFVGGTGVGKSTTINAIFNMEMAKVGDRVDPETASIAQYEMDNLVLWDTPGLGDSPEKDQRYATEIAHALQAKDANGKPLIDAVVVVVDGSSRDMSTTYEMIEHVVLPYSGDITRLIIAINQCDVALKGRYWDEDAKQPQQPLIDFLEQKVESVKKRIQESVGISTNPVYYSALYHYNISKLLLAVLTSVPAQKRFLIADNLNQDPVIWQANDTLQNYNAVIQQEVKGSLSAALEGAAKGAVAGAKVGGFIPIIGPIIGATVGAALGFLGGLMGS